jgi:hypothetical protein
MGLLEYLCKKYVDLHKEIQIKQKKKITYKKKKLKLDLPLRNMWKPMLHFAKHIIKKITTIISKIGSYVIWFFITYNSLGGH